MDQVTPEGVVAPVETPAVVSDGAAPEAVKPAAVEPPAAKPEGEEPKGVAKRIKELTEARRSAEAREARLLALLEQRTAPQPQREEEPTKGLKDFNYDEKAYLAYERERLRAEATREAKAAAERYREEQIALERRAKFDQRVEAFADTVDDYYDVVTERTPVSEAMADAIMDSDEAGPLMYYLGQNPEVARKLYGLSPAKAGREIQRIEDRLIEERKKAAEKPVSKAPPPPPKVDASGESSTKANTLSPDSDSLSDEEWVKAERARLARKRR